MRHTFADGDAFLQPLLEGAAEWHLGEDLRRHVGLGRDHPAADIDAHRRRNHSGVGRDDAPDGHPVALVGVITESARGTS